jgi:RimJ/RimL family protein N-acetyltransferase
MDEESAQAILAWRYPSPYDLYNLDKVNIQDALQVFLDPEYAYYTVADGNGDGGLAAFCCFGSDAQVFGGDYRAPGLDIGVGMRPDLTGQGRGESYVNAVLDFARLMFSPDSFRVTVAEFNQRALRVWEKVGFRPVQAFLREYDAREFVVLVREV